MYTREKHFWSVLQNGFFLPVAIGAGVLVALMYLVESVR